MYAEHHRKQKIKDVDARRYARDIEASRAKGRENVRKWRANNPEAARAANKRWREKNPHHLRNYLLKKLYGITIAERDALFAKQDFRCAICRTETAPQWHVDHCHETEVVRGILCGNCNLMVGHAKDRVATLMAAAAYLAEHKR